MTDQKTLHSFCTKLGIEDNRNTTQKSQRQSRREKVLLCLRTKPKWTTTHKSIFLFIFNFWLFNHIFTWPFHPALQPALDHFYAAMDCHHLCINQSSYETIPCHAAQKGIKRVNKDSTYFQFWNQKNANTQGSWD